MTNSLTYYHSHFMNKVRHTTKRQINMTIRAKSRKKENSVTQERKRQPFGLIEDGASRKTSNKNRKKERRKSRQIGDDVILFVRLSFIISATVLLSHYRSECPLRNTYQTDTLLSFHFLIIYSQYHSRFKNAIPKRKLFIARQWIPKLVALPTLQPIARHQSLTIVIAIP
jgi:hypothetical protein